MKKIKVLIILLIIIIIVIISSITVLLLKINKEEKQDAESLQESFEINNQLNTLSDIADYIYVKECISKYINYTNNLKNSEQLENENDIKQAREMVNGIIPEFVRNDLEVNNQNWYSKIGIEDKLFRINKVYKSLQTVNTQEYEETTSINAYYVEGVLIDRSTLEKAEFELIVVLDKINSTFAIIPENYIKENNIKLSEDIALSIYTEETIEENYANIYDANRTTDEVICQNYLVELKNGMLYDSEYAYGLLDEEYRKARFNDSYEEFKEYIENNKTKIQNIQLLQYTISRANNEVRYVCIDQNSNYYIFNETAVMQYSVILDLYTIDLPEFLEKYNTASEQQKVALNINKFIQAINAKDYKYAYSKLASGFKENYFKTQESFETYIKNNFFEENKITFNTFGNQAMTYTYKTTLTDKTTNQTKEKGFVMQLGEGTEFELSFEV